MKRIILGAVVFVAVALGAVFIVAQARSGDGDMGRFGRGPGKGMGMGFNRLGLSDEQKAKVDQIRSASQEKLKPIMEGLKAGREKLKAATKDGAFDEAAVTAIANEQAGLQAQMTVERARVHSQIHSLLTDEQKAKFGEMGNMGPGGFRGHGEARHGKRGGGGPRFGDAAAEAPIN